jgi:hypothetical protein
MAIASPLDWLAKVYYDRLSSVIRHPRPNLLRAYPESLQSTLLKGRWKPGEWLEMICCPEMQASALRRNIRHEKHYDAQISPRRRTIVEDPTPST